MMGINEVMDAYDVSSVGERYDGGVEITDLQEHLGEHVIKAFVKQICFC